jgi:hypothetical protein
VTYAELTQYAHAHIIETSNKYAVLVRASADMGFLTWNSEADPLRWAVLWDIKDIAGHKVKVPSGRALDGEPRYILRADQDTGELVPFVNICNWRGGLYYDALYHAIRDTAGCRGRYHRAALVQ